ncbi:MAG: T9SS type A sorting domain-containing protein, partial [Bacteroidota bacterium]
NEILTQLPSQYFEPLVNVFPNPVTNHIQFILLQKAEIVILNIQGQKIITLNTQEGKTNIDVSCLESGIYFIKITMDKEIVTRKFIKAQ